MDAFSRNWVTMIQCAAKQMHEPSVGAQPSENVQVLIKKYGSEGTHLKQQEEALSRLGRQPIKQPVAAS